MVEVTGSSPVLPTKPKAKSPALLRGFFCPTGSDTSPRTPSKRAVELAPVVGLYSGGDFAPDFGLALGGPSHEHATDGGVGRAHGPGIFKAEGADDGFGDAEVGQNEASDAQAPGVFEMVTGFPASSAKVSSAGRAVGMAVEDDFGAVSEPTFLHGHVSWQVLPKNDRGNSQDCKAQKQRPC